MATSKAEALEILIEMDVKAALTELQHLNEGTTEYANKLTEIKSMVELYAKTAQISFKAADAAIGSNIQKAEELTDALMKLGELRTVNIQGLENKANDVETQQTLNSLETAQLNINKDEGLLNKKNNDEQRAFIADLEAAQLRLAREAGLANEALQKSSMLFAPRDVKGGIGANNIFPSQNPKDYLNFDIQNLGKFPSTLNETVSAIQALRASNPSFTIGQIGTALKGAGANAEITEKAISKLEPATKSASQGFNVLRSAMGFLLAAGLSRVLQALTQFFGDALTTATKFRGQMAQLDFSEAILSKNGMDITRAEFDKFITDISNKYKYLTKFDVTGIVTTVADMGTEFGLTKEKILGLSDAVSFITLKEKAYGMEVSDTGSIVNAALDGRSNFFNRLGINITKTAIKEKAYADGIAQTGAELTKEQSNRAAIALLIEQTSGKYEELLASIEQVNPAIANQLRVSKELGEAQGEVGNAVMGVKDAWNGFLAAMIKNGDMDTLKTGLINIVEAIGNLITILTNAYNAFVNLKTALDEVNTSFTETRDGINKWFRSITILQLIYLGFMSIVGAITTALGILGEFFAYVTGNKSYEDAGAAVGGHFVNGLLGAISDGLKPLIEGKNDPVANSLRKTMEMIDSLRTKTGNRPDTPTGSVGNVESGQDLTEALDKLHNDMLDAQLKFNQDMADLNRDLGRKMADITLEYEQKRADIYTDYQRKIEDIQRDYDQKISDILRKQEESRQETRNRELDREKRFQDEMQRLREKFLMDLDDALHARDARQILRLQKQYELDKKQAERKHKLDDEEAKREQELQQKRFEDERRRAEEERQQQLEDAQRDYDRKLEDLRLAEERERKQALIDSVRKLQDLNQEFIDRNAITLQGLQQEFNITNENLTNLVNLYAQKYGEIANMHLSLMQLLSSAVPLAPMLNPPTDPNTPKLPPIPPPSNQPIRPAMATAAALIRRMGIGSLSSTLPADRIGSSYSRSLGNPMYAGTGGGNLRIELLLSPDLESRIISNTLNKTAEVITRSVRSK